MSLAFRNFAESKRLYDEREKDWICVSADQCRDGQDRPQHQAHRPWQLLAYKTRFEIAQRLRLRIQTICPILIKGSIEEAQK